MKSILLFMLAAVLAGCATTPTASNPQSDRLTDLLVSIQVTKTQPTATADCPVSVKITNKMNGMNWDGVSYQLGALNKLNVATGQIIGAPRKKTAPGGTVAENTKVLGVSCDTIVGLSVLYFAYYPSGKNAVHIHNSQVKAQLK